jgi:hypothetical protein
VYNKVGSMIFAARHAFRPPLSIREAARGSGIKPDLFSKMERGLVPVPPNKAHQIALALDLPGDSLREN